MTTTFAAQRREARPKIGVRRRNVAAVAMLAGLPALTYDLWMCLTFYGGSLAVPTSRAEAARLIGYVSGPTTTAVLVSVVILLVHRERRDHAMCLQKYGRDWEAYCRKVRWRIVPGLY